MVADVLTASPERARWLNVHRQHLDAPPRRPVREDDVPELLRDIAYVQWDPVPVVAPSHLLAMWARLGPFPPELLESLLWERRSLFEHWTPIASLVLTEDLAIYTFLMQRYPESLGRSWGSHGERARQFLRGHRALRTRLLAELKQGPRTTAQFSDHARTRRDDGDWAPTSDVAQMLFHLTMSGEVMVVGRDRGQNLWGRAEGFLPSPPPTPLRTREEFERATALRALRALGTATAVEINYHFVRGRYARLRETLRGLESAGAVERVHIEGPVERAERYVRTEDRPLLESRSSLPAPRRARLLPPFDNLIYSQPRTQRLFGFDYVREQFLPAEKRRFGTYVLPILWGERLIGRVDPRLDRSTGELVINSLHAEAGAPTERTIGEAIGVAISELASAVGARKVRYSRRVPAGWRSSLQ